MSVTRSRCKSRSTTACPSSARPSRPAARPRCGFPSSLPITPAAEPAHERDTRIRRAHLARGRRRARVRRVLLPVVLLFLALSVDIGNWWVHKRHLQLQVDAAALAGGALFGDCFTDSAGANVAIQNEATRFGGAGGSSYNEQVGGANKGSTGRPLPERELCGGLGLVRRHRNAASARPRA